METKKGPYVEIVKQPQARIRFRYKTEGSTAGALYAKSSDNKENSFPTIKVKYKINIIINYVYK